MKKPEDGPLPSIGKKKKKGIQPSGGQGVVPVVEKSEKKKKTRKRLKNKHWWGIMVS